jgi:hypothetical protein
MKQEVEGSLKNAEFDAVQHNEKLSAVSGQLAAREEEFKGGKAVRKRCHCEEPQATKQSLFQAKIASLRSP